MILEPRPRLARLACIVLGHEDQPLTYVERSEGPPGQGDPVTVTVIDPEAVRCSTCGRVLDPSRPTLGLRGMTAGRAVEWLREAPPYRGGR